MSKPLSRPEIDFRRRWRLHVTLPSMVVVVATAAITMLLPVPDALVAPIIMGAGYVSAGVTRRRLERLDAEHQVRS